MKITFFCFEPGEKAQVESSAALQQYSPELTFIDGLLDKDHLPVDRTTEAVCIFASSKVDAEVLAALPNLKLIATCTTGYDHIDLAACQARGITVVNVPSYGEHTVAEFAFSLLLALTRKIVTASHRVRDDGSFSRDGLCGVDLNGKIFGVIGTGRIGRHAIRMAQGFEMKVLAYDAFPDEAYAKTAGITYVTLQELLAQSDFVTLHTPYLPSTHHLINAETLALMKPTALLINTSRGGVVDTQALLMALTNNKLGGAGLDVLEEEGAVSDELNFLKQASIEGHDLKAIIADHALIDLPNVIITPHNAYNTEEALVRILGTTITNIAAYLSGQPVNVVKLS